MEAALQWISEAIRERLRWISDLPIDEAHPLPPLGRLISMIANSAQYLNLVLQKEITDGEEFLKTRPNLTAAFGYINTRDKASLETIHLIPNVLKKVSHDKRRYVIWAVGRRNFFQTNAENMVKLANTLLDTSKPTVIVGFNYRQLGKSHARTADLNREVHYVEDIHSIYDSLLNQGVPPARITLIGHSLSGGIIPLLLAKLPPDKRPRRIFLDRTYVDLIIAGVNMFVLPAIIGLVIGIAGCLIAWWLSYGTLYSLGIGFIAGAAAGLFTHYHPRPIRVWLRPLFEVIMGLGGSLLDAASALKHAIATGYDPKNIINFYAARLDKITGRYVPADNILHDAALTPATIGLDMLDHQPIGPIAPVPIVAMAQAVPAEDREIAYRKLHSADWRAITPLRKGHHRSVLNLVAGATSPFVTPLPPPTPPADKGPLSARFIRPNES